MRISLFSFLSGYPADSLIDAYVADLRAARDDGFTTVWNPQLPYEPDLVVAMAIALREVDGITLGTGVLPIQSRLPMVLAQQALTLSLISGGRLKLGIGLTHAIVTEGMWGIPWDRPVRRLNEYLDGLLPLLAGEEAKATGETISTRGSVVVPGATAPPVYVAALGPQLLRVAGRRTAGTVTWMTGAQTLADHVVPSIRAAAEEVGRHADVVAAFPVCVTDEPDAARAQAAQTLAVYGMLPSYRAMLDREGLAGPADIAMIGTEEVVAEQMEAVRAAGVDEFSATILHRNEEERARTRAFLRSRLG
jgi:5,10-methylenetetrahydromethanopterin reductase